MAKFRLKIPVTVSYSYDREREIAFDVEAFDPDEACQLLTEFLQEKLQDYASLKQARRVLQEKK